MRELLNQLPEGARVLDLGCGESAARAPDGVRMVRIDLEPRSVPGFVQADAARLPFPAALFDAVISNHSLEHIQSLDCALREIGRVIRPQGRLYVAVPDASTLTDRIYRWLGRGGGHVNAFTSAEDLARRIEDATGLKAVGTRTLLSSLCFLNRANLRTRIPRKLLLLGGGTAISLLAGTYALKLADRFFGTRLSIYGWALFFGNFPVPVDSTVRSNVCIRCGSGHVSAQLAASFLYRCPQCGARNVFTDDRPYQAMR